MNRDDIIRMAREAGIVVTGEAVWKLCELVAAAEREACAKVCIDRAISYRNETDPWAHEHIGEAETCAAAIRARGQA